MKKEEPVVEVPKLELVKHEVVHEIATVQKTQPHVETVVHQEPVVHHEPVTETPAV